MTYLPLPTRALYHIWQRVTRKYCDLWRAPLKMVDAEAQRCSASKKLVVSLQAQRQCDPPVGQAISSADEEDCCALVGHCNDNRRSGWRGVMSPWLIPAGTMVALLFFPLSAWAAEKAPTILNAQELAASIALLVPLGLLLIALASVPLPERESAAFSFPAAIGLAGVLYFLVGFAFEFGGFGLIDSRPDFAVLVREWTALSPAWSRYWGMAGVTGFFLGHGADTPGSLALFLSQLPWIISATLVPMVVTRRYGPTFLAILLGGVSGGIIAPVVGNWIYGGGWLHHLGVTAGWGHGYLDVGGLGMIALVAAGMSWAVLLAFRPRRPARVGALDALPALPSPLLAVLGSGLLLAGGSGWFLALPLFPSFAFPWEKMLLNLLLAASGGALLPLLYVWFFSGEQNLVLPARGLAAGWLSLLAGAPFLPPWAALLVGVLVGALLPLWTAGVDRFFRLPDDGGLLAVVTLAGFFGVWAPAFLADGRFGQGWQDVGAGHYLGVAGQGVSGLLVAGGLRPDWPGQFWAQFVGSWAIFLFAFLASSIIAWPVATIWERVLKKLNY